MADEIVAQVQALLRAVMDAPREPLVYTVSAVTYSALLSGHRARRPRKRRPRYLRFGGVRR